VATFLALIAANILTLSRNKSSSCSCWNTCKYR